MIVIGHNAADKECWLINLPALPNNEQAALWQIASSPAAQQTPYLANLLSTTGFIKDGTETWWARLITQVDPVLVVPRSEVGLDPEQQHIFEMQERRAGNRVPYNARTAEIVQQMLEKGRL